MEAGLAFRAFQLEVIADRRIEPPQDDLVSVLCHAEIDGERLDDESIIMESLLILIGGDETRRHVITDGMLALLEHPDQLAILRDDPTAMEVGVEELLRWVSPIKNMARTVTRDVELARADAARGRSADPHVSVGEPRRNSVRRSRSVRCPTRSQPASRLRVRSAFLHGRVARTHRAEGDVLRAVPAAARPPPRRRPATRAVRRTSSPARKRCRSSSRRHELESLTSNPWRRPRSLTVTAR